MGGVEACRKPATTESISSTSCTKCGKIKKSGKNSCCGRGGSWFKDCGSGGNSKFGHTWSEGIRACKTLAQSSKTGIDQRYAMQQPNASTGPGVVNLKAITTAAKISTFTPANAPTTTLPSTILLTVVAAIWLFIRKDATSQQI